MTKSKTFIFNLILCAALALFASGCKQSQNTVKEKKPGNPTTEKNGNTEIKRVLVFEKEVALKSGIYEAAVSKETESASILGNIKVECADSKAQSTVSEKDSSPLADGDGASKSYIIKVKAEDGTEKNYELKILRGKSGNTEIKRVLVFEKEAVLKSGVYEAAVSKETESVSILGNIKVECADSKAQSTVSEKDSSPLAAGEGASKTYVIKVKAEDGTEKDYELKILRGKSGNAFLKSLNITKGSLSFSKSIFTYAVQLEKTETEFTVQDTITAEAEDPNASVVIAPQGKVQIADNPKIEITVTAEDGQTKNTYSIVFKHKPEAKYRELIKVITENKNITGALPDWFGSLPKEEKHPAIKGVFVEGRTVTLTPYEIAKHEVCYELWYEVREWAEKNGYTFIKKGCQGSEKGEKLEDDNFVNDGKEPTEDGKYLPVTRITWNDAAVWCNAYSEYSGLEAVYYHENKIIKNAVLQKDGNPIFSYAVMKKEKNGFRLPTEAEWEFAARGGDSSKPDWNFRFGASNDPSGAAIAIPNKAPAQPVTHNFANRLGILNMCGNMTEFCWDWYELYLDASTPADGPAQPQSLLLGKRARRGGCVSMSSATGAESPAYVTERTEVLPDSQISTTTGFRVAKSLK